MKKPSYRIERINETIKEVLSELLLSAIKDPRVGMVTITAVRVSSDLSSAKVHYSVMGNEVERAETEKGLRSAKNFMRTAVSNELKLRNAPELRFVYDDSLDKSYAIEEALKKTKPEPAQKDDSPDDDSPETGAPDIDSPETGAPDIDSPETGSSDAGASDAGASDAGGEIA
jgi:ribosome-binding factor A